jgi:hypothetical protein
VDGPWADFSGLLRPKVTHLNLSAPRCVVSLAYFLLRFRPENHTQLAILNFQAVSFSGFGSRASLEPSASPCEGKPSRGGGQKRERRSCGLGRVLGGIIVSPSLFLFVEIFA